MTDAIADGMDARSASKDHQWLIRTLKEPTFVTVWFFLIFLIHRAHDS